MAFITGQTNRRLGRKSPSDYLVDIVQKQGPAALESRRVPTDGASLVVPYYKEFLTARRGALAEGMNAFIDQKAGA
jgi:hypothetical protein